MPCLVWWWLCSAAVAAGRMSLRRFVFIVADGRARSGPQKALQDECRHHGAAMTIPRTPPKMFETRSQAGREVGLLRQISPRVVKRARLEALLLVPLFIAVVVLYDHRVSLLGTQVAAKPGPHGHPAYKYVEQALDTPIRVATVIALMILGWAIARDIGRGLGPALFRRLDPATAGTVGFLIRLATVAVALVVALDVAGVRASPL